MTRPKCVQYMKKIILCMLCCLSSFVLAAQGIAISGKIVDKNTHNPISYANIIVEKSGIGVISNEDGEFVLNVEAISLKDTVKVTHIGYDAYVISLSDLKALNKGIEMDISPKVLDEIVIRPSDAVVIVKEAFQKIKKNYSQVPYGMKAFCREDVQENKKIIELAEALVEVYLSAYDGEKAVWEIRPLKGRKDRTTDTLNSFKFLPSRSYPDALFYQDMVHKSRDFLLTNFTENSDMELTDVINFNGQQVYEISFDEKENVSQPLFKGKIFIEAKSLAIVRVEYGASPNGTDFDNFNKAQKAVPENEAHYMHEGYYVIINYERKDSIWYLHDIVGDYHFHVNKAAGNGIKPVDSRLDIHCELSITDILNKQISKVKFVANRHAADWIFNKINNYDPHYWDHINYIAPSRRIVENYDTLMNIKQ